MTLTFHMQIHRKYDLNKYIIVFAYEKSKFITNYKLRFWVYKKFVILIFCMQIIFMPKSHIIHLMVDYRILSNYSNLKKENNFYYLKT